MAKRRTPEEREQIIKKCVEIEKAGGDVLEYLKEENFISPKATWYNIQKIDLGRSRFSSGRSKENAEEREDRKKMERVTEILQTVKNGGRIRSVMCGWGIRNVREQGQVYRFLRKWAEEWQPDLYAKMPEKLEPVAKGQQEPKKRKQTEKKQTEVTMEKVDRVPEIHAPEKKGTAGKAGTKYRVLELETALGRYRMQDGDILFGQDGSGMDIRLCPEEWRQLAAEVPEVLKVLEVSE